MPKLTIVEFLLEKGFASSTSGLRPDLFIFNDDGDRNKGLNDYEQTFFEW